MKRTFKHRFTMLGLLGAIIFVLAPSLFAAMVYDAILHRDSFSLGVYFWFSFSWLLGIVFMLMGRELVEIVEGDDDT